MSRPGPVITADGRADSWSGSPIVPRVRPSRNQVRIALADGPTGWGPHPDARTHQQPAAPSPTPATAPVPVSVPTSQALVPVDPPRLPALVTPDGPRLTFVQRVTRMLQRLGGGRGRHRTGHSCHHWSMFAPHPGARRRPGGRSRPR